MENEKLYYGKKVVDIHPTSLCYSPLFGPFKDPRFNEIVSTGSIKYLLGRGAVVKEVLASGEKIELNVDNYNLWLDEGEMPEPGYEPEIPETGNEGEEETEEPGKEPETPEEPGDGEDEDTKPEPGEPTDPNEEDEESGDKGQDGEVIESETDILDQMPDGLSSEEQDQWLEENIG